MWWSQRDHKWRHNMEHTSCKLDKQGYTHTPTRPQMCNIYCFSTLSIIRESASMLRYSTLCCCCYYLWPITRKILGKSTQFKFLIQLLFLHFAISSIIQPNIFLTLVTPELAHSTSEMTKVSHSFINKSNHIVQQQAFSRFNLLVSVVCLKYVLHCGSAHLEAQTIYTLHPKLIPNNLIQKNTSRSQTQSESLHNLLL
jgi:hypothetical protein